MDFSLNITSNKRHEDREVSNESPDLNSSKRQKKAVNLKRSAKALSSKQELTTDRNPLTNDNYFQIFSNLIADDLLNLSRVCADLRKRALYVLSTKIKEILPDAKVSERNKILILQLTLERFRQTRYLDHKIPSNGVSVSLAAKYGNTRLLLELFSLGFYADYNHDEPLRMACKFAHTEVSLMLLSRPEVNAAANNNEPLKWACRNGMTEVVQSLDRIVKPSKSDWQVALNLACENGHLNIVKVITLHRVIEPLVCQHVLEKIVQSGCHEVLRFLLPKLDLSQESKYKLLAIAVERDYSNMIPLLLSLNIRLVDITIALINACSYFHIGVIQRMLEHIKTHSLKVNLSNIIEHAYQYDKNGDVLRLLMSHTIPKYGTIDNLENIKQLNEAALWGNVERIKVLVSTGVCAQANLNSTLRLASRMDKTKLLRFYCH